ncbi:MAG: hypothetical protein HZA50_09935 [Planctomycetes bacterium]|nr:hypothetical protein [Planctomycetota bacterium]
MHRITACSLLLMVAGSLGCTEEQLAKMRWWEKKQPAPASQAGEPATKPENTGPAAAPDAKSEHQGFCITVLIDSSQTVSDKIDGGRQFWNGRVISPTPTVKYEVDKSYFGSIRSVEMNFNPVRDGQADTNNVWQCEAVDLKPGESRNFKNFYRIVSGKQELPVSELAPGQYIMYVTVNGERDGNKIWDRQMIRVEVK